MDDRALELTVSWHPSGRYTLMEKSGTSTTDVHEENLLANDNPATFYRAVALHMSKRIAEGWIVTYRDTNID